MPILMVIRKRRVNTFAQVAVESLVSQYAYGFCFFLLFVCSFFEGRRREGTIQDFSMIHRYFSTNLNQMILYTVE